jgi:hypothetical protein
MTFKRSQMRLIGSGAALVAVAAAGALFLPSVFHPDEPFPRNPHLSEMLLLGSAACGMLSLFRWLVRREIRSGRMNLNAHPKPIDAWRQWALHVDPLGQVIDD